MLADQPQQVADGPLLTAGRAVAVVQEQDHAVASLFQRFRPQT
jgi:hypothetical protein